MWVSRWKRLRQLRRRPDVRSDPVRETPHMGPQNFLNGVEQDKTDRFIERMALRTSLLQPFFDPVLFLE